MGEYQLTANDGSGHRRGNRPTIALCLRLRAPLQRADTCQAWIERERDIYIYIYIYMYECMYVCTYIYVQGL